jgi:hypothetical protein
MQKIIQIHPCLLKLSRKQESVTDGRYYYIPQRYRGGIKKKGRFIVKFIQFVTLWCLVRDILGYLVIKNNDLKIGSIKLVYSLFMVFCAGLLSPIDKIRPQITLNEPLCLHLQKNNLGIHKIALQVDSAL